MKLRMLRITKQNQVKDNMNYCRLYDSLIARAKTRILDCYRERHHIIPKCLGGSNLKDNIAELTAREHFLCHMLLCRIYPSSKGLWYAAHAMMIMKSTNQSRNYRVSSRQYAEIKSNLKEHMKGRILSEETKRKISEARMGRVMSPETKAKLSLANKGKKLSEKHKQSLSRKGYTHSEETKRKLSDAAKASSEETKRKMSEAAKGRPKSENHKRRMSIAQQARRLRESVKS